MNWLSYDKISPESAGIPSKSIVDFCEELDFMGLYTHSLLIAKGDRLIYESYYKPFSQNSQHRIYSVSKSFVSAAIGVAVTQGLLCLDDVILDYFPEYQNEHTCDGMYTRCTIRDMLKMSSNVGTNVYWWGKFANRVEAYYSQNSLKAPGNTFYYDSIGSFLLGAIIQKLTGMDFLEYLKQNALLELGFSEESRVLTEPGGYAVGDSAVLCTLRDLLILARLFAKGGMINGKRYIDAQYVREATSVQAFNDLYSGLNSFNTAGYGYLIWITAEGFAFFGAGDQLMFYDRQRDITFVIQSDNQGISSSTDMIYHLVTQRLLKNAQFAALPENPEALDVLRAYEVSRQLRCQYGIGRSAKLDSINGVRYHAAIENNMGITDFCLRFFEDKGKLEFVRNQESTQVLFGFGCNVPCEFSFGQRAHADHMGIWSDGKYHCVASAGFVREDTLAIKLQVIDTYFGKLQITIAFDGDEANLYIKKHGQYVFDGIEGYVFAKAERKLI